MGFGADWSRQRYTLDDTLNRCVNETFTKMYDAGLIYRGHRIVGTGIKTRNHRGRRRSCPTRRNHQVLYLQYGPFQISTARPETKFGDKYVVMHPDDERYKQYKHGSTFEAEWINGTVTASVIKDEAVDPSFGTGVMTSPLARPHRLRDRQRYGLREEQVIDFDGTLLPIAARVCWYADQARPLIVEKLEKKASG